MNEPKNNGQQAVSVLHLTQKPSEEQLENLIALLRQR
jgi:hypothetical protein